MLSGSSGLTCMTRFSVVTNSCVCMLTVGAAGASGRADGSSDGSSVITVAAMSSIGVFATLSKAHANRPAIAIRVMITVAIGIRYFSIPVLWSL